MPLIDVNLLLLTLLLQLLVLLVLLEVQAGAAPEPLFIALPIVPCGSLMPD